MTAPLLERVSLDGFDIAAPQILGSIMLFPVLDPEPRDDLRLHVRGYSSTGGVVDLDDGTNYAGYIPHSLIVDWRRDGEVVAQYGTDLRWRNRRRRLEPEASEVPVFRRMVRRIDRSRVRLLPLHLAMEGFLALQFGGPAIAWTDWSRQTRNHGLSFRAEAMTPGRAIDGLDEALGLFEIHENQVGVLVFDTGVLLSAFIAARPDDYRALHHTLIEDFYGDVLFHQASMENVASVDLELNLGRTNGNQRTDETIDLGALEDAVGDVRRRWHDLAKQISTGLIDQPVTSEQVYRLSPFRLERFRTGLDLETESHIGEAIVDKRGRIRYLKTFRLTKAQTRRGALLQFLARHDWNLDDAAAADGNGRDQLILRISNAGFGYLLNPEVLAQAAAAARNRRQRPA